MMMTKNNPMQMINQIKQNPLGFLAQKKLNVPPEILDDPNKIMQHLMNTGQISQEAYNNAIQQAMNMGYKP